MFERILLAVDTWDQARGAVATAIDLVTKSRGEVLVVHVHDTGLVSRETVDEARDEARLLTEAAVGVLARRGRRAPGGLKVARSAGVARQILHEAKGFDADTIVLGSRGLGGFAGLPLGSVAHRVIQLADCPVVVAPAAEATDAIHARDGGQRASVA
jgi:nucleotide-binding universal stress UspA family protein